MMEEVWYVEKQVIIVENGFRRILHIPRGAMEMAILLERIVWLSVLGNGHKPTAETPTHMYARFLHVILPELVESKNAIYYNTY